MTEQSIKKTKKNNKTIKNKSKRTISDSLRCLSLNSLPLSIDHRSNYKSKSHNKPTQI